MFKEDREGNRCFSFTPSILLFYAMAVWGQLINMWPYLLFPPVLHRRASSTGRCFSQ